MVQVVAGKAPSRGRPAAGERRDVLGAIKLAAERALDERSPGEITLRQIAEDAGTTEAMIQYYFGNNEGLFVAMCDDWMAHLPSIFNSPELLDRCVVEQSILPFIEAAHTFYASRPGLVRMIIVELIRGESEVQNTYRRKYSAQRARLIELVICRLVDAGVYRADTDARLVIVSMMSLLVFPVSIERTFAAAGADAGALEEGVWVRFIADMLDGQFRKIPPH